MNMIGKCGDNCEYCPRYIATKSGSTTELEKVKELWVRLDLRDPDFPVQDMVCYGCRPENKCAYEELCTCIITKKLENCGLCKEYPCKLIKSVFDTSEKLKSQARMVCTNEEMELLNKAFFSKKKYFNHIHHRNQMR